ncbi:uncharacterized protein LOC107611366 [Arachis ipaensis]|uniref:uncharacterized protein LOC107611366 n=1 Tax=Arachis ipaensis TaxID=130454 RepID=UPI0007AF6902|nr:uncharacterized protein LOC107611366 [Arachis ipaensis]
MNGLEIPIKLTFEGQVVPKEDREWTEEEKKKVESNAKAMNMVYCAISFEEYKKISRCKSTKEIWQKLQVTHEGTNQIRETRIDMLMKDYELFFMKEKESIDEMFKRSSIIINRLDAMGKPFTEKELVRKILRNLTKKWETKTTAVQEGNNLNQITYYELRGKLLAYETTHLKTENKKKSVALKLMVETESDENFPSDNEIVFFARRLRKMIRYKGRKIGSSSKEDKKENKENCHYYKKLGHFKSECPMLKRKEESKKEKKNVLMATWEDLENDTSDDDEDVCLMTKYNESKNKVNLYDCTAEELHEIIDDLTHNSSKLLSKYSKYKKEVEDLRYEISSLKAKLDIYYSTYICCKFKKQK